MAERHQRTVKKKFLTMQKGSEAKSWIIAGVTGTALIVKTIADNNLDEDEECGDENDSEENKEDKKRD